MCSHWAPPPGCLETKKSYNNKPSKRVVYNKMNWEICGFQVQETGNNFHDDKEEKEDPGRCSCKVEVSHSSEIWHGFADFNPIL